LNGLLILSEIGGPGAWTNVYTGPRDAQFDLPTVEGVDYPNMGISKAFNVRTDNTLHISTYAATAARRGAGTTFKVSQLPDPQAVQVYLNGEPFKHWGVVESGTIEIETTIDSHEFRIVSSAAAAVSKNQQTSAAPALKTNFAGATAARTEYRAAAPPSCSCC